MHPTYPPKPYTPNPTALRSTTPGSPAEGTANIISKSQENYPMLRTRSSKTQNLKPSMTKRMSARNGTNLTESIRSRWRLRNAPANRDSVERARVSAGAAQQSEPSTVQGVGFGSRSLMGKVFRDTLGRPPTLIIVAIGDNKDNIRVLVYSYSTTTTG